MRQLRFSALSVLLCVAIISSLVVTAFPLNMRTMAATTWYVATTGSDTTGNGSSVNPWRTMAYAVASASVLNGDTISVAAGTYTESVSTTKSLTFRGAQWGVDARDRTGSETAWVVPSPATPTALDASVTVGAITVDGFKFVGGPSCVDLRPDSVVFSHNIVEVPDGCSGPTNVYSLVKLSSVGSVIIQYNDISTTEPTLLPGVACVDVRLNTNPGTVTVIGNRFHNASGSGGFTFEQGVNAGTMTFANNEIYDNAGDGIYVHGKFETLTATYNSIHDNTGNGFYLSSIGTTPSAVSIEQCDIYGNGLYGLYNASESGRTTIDAAQNFWGDGTEQYPYNVSGAAFGPDITGVATDPLPGPACAPSVTTNDATNIATASARLNGSLTSLGSATSVTVSFVWGTSSGSYPYETAGQVRTTTGAFFFDLGSLASGTTYYYRAKAAGNGTTYGAEKSFTTTTAPTAPSVTTNDATNISTTSARLNGNLTSLGTAGSVTVSFVWGTSSGSHPYETTGQVRTTTGAFFFDLGSLASGTTYYYEAKAVGSGTSYGTERSFTTTTPATPPSVTTSVATNIATTSARLNGNLTSLGTAGSVTVSFVWGTSPGSRTFETTPQVLTATGVFFFDLGSLSPGVTYCYEAKAVGSGISYGTERSFATATVLPSVTTNAASNVANTSARLNGNLTSLGSASSVTVSFVWGTSSGSYPNETTSQVLTATGAFLFDLGSLTPGTTYYYEAKAAGDGTTYGTERSFATTIIPTTSPSVTTNDAFRANTVARLNGNLTSLGSASSATVSFVWGTSSGSYPNETTGQVVTATGAFFFNLASLTPGTTYYYNAKAVANGTSYGAEKSFTTTVSYFGSGWYEQFTGYRPSPSAAYVFGLNRVCQTFTPSKDHYFNSVALLAYKAGKPYFAVTISLYKVDENTHQPKESALCSTTFAASSLPTTVTTWRTYGFTTDCKLTGGTEYAIVISGNGGDPSNRVNIRTYAADGYLYGQLGISSNTEEPWQWTMRPGDDMAFKEGQGTWHESLTSTYPGIPVYGQNQAYQTFTPSRDHYFNYVSLYLYKIGSPAFTVTISLQPTLNHKPTGEILCSTTFAASLLSATAAWRAFWFSPGCQVSASTQYALVLSCSTAGNGWVVARTDAAGGYAAGNCGLSTDGGASWQETSGSDLAFNEGDYPWYTASIYSNSVANVYGQYQLCQTFTPSSSHYFDYVSLSLYTVGIPTYNITIALYKVDENTHQPKESALCSTTFATSSLKLPKPSSNTYPWYQFRFTNGYELSQGTEYALVLSGDGGDAANRVAVRISARGGYFGGQRGASIDSGATWQMLPAQDMAFMEGGSPTAAQAGTGWYQQFTGHAAPPSAAYIYGQSQVCQTFTPSKDHYFNSVTLQLGKVGRPNFTVTISLYNVDGYQQPAGSALCSTTFAASSLSTTMTWRTYVFAAGWQLSAGTDYALVLSASGGTLSNLSNSIRIRTYPADGYSYGQLGVSSSAEEPRQWMMMADSDMAFKEGQNTWSESLTSAIPGIRVYGLTQAYQAFTPSSDHYVNYVSLYLYKIGSPTHNVTISVHEVDGNGQPVQPALCSTTFAAKLLPTKAAWRTYSFYTGYTVSGGTQYALVISGSGSNGLVIAGTNSIDGYSGGGCGLSTDGGGTWQALSGPDLAFREGELPWNTGYQGVTNYFAAVYGQNQQCQTFTPSRTHYFDYLSLPLYRLGNPMYTVTISLYNVDGNHRPAGSALCSTTFAASSVTLPLYFGRFPWYEFRFPTGCQLSQGTEYALVLSGDGGDAANFVRFPINVKGGYPGGQRGSFAEGGTTWQMLPTQDMAFIDGGMAIT